MGLRRDVGPVGDDVMPDSELGAVQRECGGDQLGSTLEEFGELVWVESFGYVANVGGDSFDDALGDGKILKTDESSVGKINEETLGLEEVGPQD